MGVVLCLVVVIWIFYLGCTEPRRDDALSDCFYERAQQETARAEILASLRQRR